MDNKRQIKVLYYSSFCDFSMIGLIDSIKNDSRVLFNVLLEEQLEIGIRSRVFYNYDWFYYVDILSNEELDSLFNNCDVILVGHNEKRLFVKANKAIPLFFMTERRYKNPIKENLITYFRKEARYFFKRNVVESNKYLLTYGAFVYRDVVHDDIGFRNHAFSFSYLTPSINISFEEIKKDNDRIDVIWIGYAEEKRNVHFLSYFLKKTKNISNKYHLTIIGGGKNNLPKELLNGQFKNCCSVLGEVPFKETHKYLKRAFIVLTTGYRYEGFNISIQQGMGYGAIPVSPIYSGSTLEYIKNGYNGFIYFNRFQMVRILKKVIKNERKRKIISRRAYDTIKNDKNPSLYSKRLVDVIIGVTLNTKKCIYKNGPLAKALNLCFIRKVPSLFTLIKLLLIRNKIKKVF